MKQQILNRWTGAVLFECDVPDEVGSGLAMRHALQAAVSARANLAGAYLAGADLAGAYLDGAKWRDGIVIHRVPLQVHGLLWSVTILDQHMQIGCELHSLHDWERFDERRIAEMDGREAVRFWRAHGPGLLALARGDGRSFEPVVASSQEVEA